MNELISSIAIAGADSNDFLISGKTCATTLGAKESCTISVEFTPKKTGALSAKLEVSDSPDPNSPETASLSGTGT